MVVSRKTFEDYLAFTGHQYYTAGGIHKAEYDPLLPHPYGVHSKSEHPGRVHAEYHNLTNYIEQKMDQVHQARSQGAIKFFFDRVELRIHSKSRFYNPWNLVAWGLRTTIEKGYKRLIVDAREAHILCPTIELLKVAELDPHTLARLDGISAALAGGIQIQILSTHDAVWGLWQELGAEIVREPDQASAPTRSAQEASTG